MKEHSLQKVDHSALRTNQSLIIGLSIAAFVLNAPWLAALIALVMAVGTYRRVPGFGFIYQRILKPRGWIKPDVLQDNPEPHRFSQGFGAVVLGIAVAALFLGANFLGWALVWLVVALAALNLFLGFCAGCAVYYWLNRLNIPGFVKPPARGNPRDEAESPRRPGLMLLEILLRLLLAAAIIGAGIAAYWLARRLLLARVRGKRLGLESLQPGIPGILYFTTPDCIPCRTFQRPELQKLKDHMGKKVQVVEVDATEKPDLADYWGVLSVPTTFIIDSKGQARGMNFGAASAERLYQQICEVESDSPEYGLSERGVTQ